eukprot:COSAG05_NODE_800_length_7226_cov_4.300126_8_plen_58_part_00
MIMPPAGACLRAAVPLPPRAAAAPAAAAAPTAAIGGLGTEEISEWLQGGSCTQDLHA